MTTAKPDPFSDPGQPSRLDMYDARMNAMNADELAMHGLLDELVRRERLAASPAFEAAIFAASRLQIRMVPADLVPVAQGVDVMVRHDQLAAPMDLEAQAFELSREAVTSGRFIDHSTDSSSPQVIESAAPVTRVRTFQRSLVWSARIAAAAAVVVSGAWLMLQRTPATTSTAAIDSDPSAAELASRIGTEMDALFEVISLGHDGVAIDASTNETELDPSWVEDLFSQEAL